MREAEKLFDAITGVREELVEQAQNYRFAGKKPIRWQRYAGMAGCLALMVTVGLGALRLGVIGGAGSDSAASDSVSMDMDGGTSIESSGSTAGSANNGGWMTGDAPASTDKESTSDGVDAVEVTFTATVLEVYEDAVLVEPAEDSAERQRADQIVVSLRGIADLLTVKVGTVVTVTYDGTMDDAYPAQISAMAIAVP